MGRLSQYVPHRLSSSQSTTLARTLPTRFISGGSLQCPLRVDKTQSVSMASLTGSVAAFSPSPQLNTVRICSNRSVTLLGASQPSSKRYTSPQQSHRHDPTV